MTRSASASNFDADGVHVLCGPETFTEAPGAQEAWSGCPGHQPYVGEQITVYGKQAKDHSTVAATRIELKIPEWKDASGSAVVDAAPVRSGPLVPPGGLLLRADGYWILVPAQAKISSAPPVLSANDVQPNLWLDYKAKPRSDGVLVAESARFMPIVVSPAEEKLRAKVRYDPAAASAADRQSAWMAGLTGIDFQRIPPWGDKDMQSRVAAIGARLVPAYQTALPDSAPAKIDFRFEVVDANWGLWPVALPNGYILVPYKAVERMQNDDQLAALLAEPIATLLERQVYRMRTTMKALSAGSVASQAAMFIPGAGLAALAGNVAFGSGEATVVLKEMAQAARVSLDLTHDAGFDVQQAPIAWWLLVSRDPRPITETAMPWESATLYQILGKVWRDPPAVSSDQAQP
ncbi:MAG: hypothetical protein WA294_02215 [Acidobacteriaceae bacterium]